MSPAVIPLGRGQAVKGLVRSWAFCAGLTVWAGAVAGATGSLPLTPPMGWSSWAAGYDCVNAPIRREHVESIVQVIKNNKFDELGWRYICLDDAMFAAERDENGNLQLDPTRFPGGLPWLIGYLHANGLKAGAYLVAGTASNCGSAGSMGHWFQDGKFIADVGFDFVKISYDSGPHTWGPEGTIYDGYREIIRCLRASTNEIFINASVHDFLPWMREELNSWHTVCEVGDANGQFWNFLARLDFTTQTSWAVRPGYFMDADFIKFPVSAQEARVEFGMNCLIQGQLLVGRFSDDFLQLVGNGDAIAINQDPLVAPASVVTNDSKGAVQVWAKPFEVKDGTRWAFGFLNRSYYSPASGSLSFTNLPLSGPVGTILDVWSGQVLGSFTNAFSTMIPPASLGLYVLQVDVPAWRKSLRVEAGPANLVLLSWSGGSGILVQTAENLDGPWSDIGLTEGNSQAVVARDKEARFFRLRRR